LETRIEFHNLEVLWHRLRVDIHALADVHREVVAPLLPPRKPQLKGSPAVATEQAAPYRVPFLWAV